MSGFSGPAAKYISPSNDYNRSGGEGTINVNVMSNMSQLSNRTNDRLFQVASEPVESSEMIVSSYYRVTGTPFTFTSDIGGPLFRPRQIQLRNVIMPFIPNINEANNQICLQFVRNFYVSDSNAIVNPIDVNITIPFGFYTPNDLSNEVASKVHEAVNAQFVGKPFSGADYIVSIEDASYNASYDSTTGRFFLNVDIYVVKHRIYDNSAPEVTSGTNNSSPPLFQFWMTSDCSFALRGKNVVEFPTSEPRRYTAPTNPGGTTPYAIPGWDPNPFNPVPGKLRSFFGPSFIYSRYVTISSDALALYAYGESRIDQTDGGGGAGKIIGAISTSEYYMGTNSFTGAQRIAAVDAPVLAIKNSQLKLNNLIDFAVTDEFGLSLDRVFPADNTAGPTLAFIINY
jgi:hypothetical protein